MDGISGISIHYIVREGDILPHIESFIVRTQSTPCPPNIIDIIQYKIMADLSKNPSLREFDFPYPTCPIHATIEVRSPKDD